MTGRKVDVLAVMDAARTGPMTLDKALDLLAARAAVAELIYAAKDVSENSDTARRLRLIDALDRATS